MEDHYLRSILGIICSEYSRESFVVLYSYPGRQVWAQNNDFGAALQVDLTKGLVLSVVQAISDSDILKVPVLYSTLRFYFLCLHCWTQLCSVCCVICFSFQY